MYNPIVESLLEAELVRVEKRIANAEEEAAFDKTRYEKGLDYLNQLISHRSAVTLALIQTRHGQSNNQ